MEKITCDCGHESEPTQYTGGYGLDRDGKTHCYQCCADIERASMVESGKATLYLVEEDGKSFVTDFGGKLSFPVRYRKTGRHNFAGNRYDVWFGGPGGQWHGVTYGDMTQICHCKRTK